MQTPNALAAQFLLRKDITFLNFGSFGACPRPIFEAYQNWQRQLEEEPVQFMAFNSNTYFTTARKALGTYINCNEEDIVLVTNPSYAVNIIAKSLPLQPNDEILATNIEYGACDKTWQYYCDKAGAHYIRQHIDLPLTTKEKFVEDIFKSVTSRTKLIFISHITSSTALRLPVEEVCAKAKAMGIMTFVDGAHAPGQIPLDISTLHADIYTGACHKWMMAPKGCSFLYVHKDWQNIFDPLIISWGYNSATPSDSQFIDYHQMQGTRDISAFLTLPTCITFMQENNWPTHAAECRALVRTNAKRFCDLLHTTPLSPIHEDFLVQLFSIPVHCKQPMALQQLLYHQYKIEIPVMTQNNQVFIRYAIQVFNTQADLDVLYNALQNIIDTTDLIQLNPS